MDVENEPLADPIMSELVKLSEEDMRDIEARAFENKSIRAFSREWGCIDKASQKKLMVKLDRLAEAWRQSAHR